VRPVIAICCGFLPMIFVFVSFLFPVFSLIFLFSFVRQVSSSGVLRATNGASRQDRTDLSIAGILPL
jgi:hypothetical protein